MPLNSVAEAKAHKYHDNDSQYNDNDSQYNDWSIENTFRANKLAACTLVHSILQTDSKIAVSSTLHTLSALFYFGS